MWQSQVENEHYSTVSGLIRFVISLECVIENYSRFSVSLYELLNYMHSKFQSHSYWQSLVESLYLPCDCHIIMIM